MTTISQLQERYDAISTKVYTEAVGEEIKTCLNTFPDPDENNKLEVLTLRCKFGLLLPSFTEQSEADIKEALELSPEDASLWVLSSETLWKRNALDEALTALESALRLEPKSLPALCQKSLIQRATCGTKAPAEQVLLLEESVNIARQAVGIDATNPDAWVALGIGLLQQTISTGFEQAALKKSHAALSQARMLSQKKGVENPDVYYNLAVAANTLGNYGDAHTYYMQAYQLDPVGLKGALGEAQHCEAILFDGYHTSLMARSKKQYQLLLKPKPTTTSNKTLTKREEAKLKKKKLADESSPTVEEPTSFLEQFRATHHERITIPGCLTVSTFPVTSSFQNENKAQLHMLPVQVVKLVSKVSAQPLAYLCIDATEIPLLLNVYCLLDTALTPGDIVQSVFPPSTAEKKTHSVVRTPSSQSDRHEEEAGKQVDMNIFTVTVDSKSMLVNGAKIAAKFLIAPRLATRLFQ